MRSGALDSIPDCGEQDYSSAQDAAPVFICVESRTCPFASVVNKQSDAVICAGVSGPQQTQQTPWARSDTVELQLAGAVEMQQTTCHFKHVHPSRWVP